MQAIKNSRAKARNSSLAKKVLKSSSVKKKTIKGMNRQP